MMKQILLILFLVTILTGCVSSSESVRQKYVNCGHLEICHGDHHHHNPRHHHKDFQHKDFQSAGDAVDAAG